MTETNKYIMAAVSSHLTEASPQAEQPASVKAALRPHQLSLLAAAKNLEAKASISHVDLQSPQLLTRYGVLADRVGSGKSLVALSLVREPPVEHAQFTVKEGGSARLIGLKHMPAVQKFRTEWADLSGNALMNAVFGIGSSSASSKFHSDVSLFIVPHNVIQQWESYINDQTTLRARIIKRTKDCDHERAGFFADILTAELVVVSCTMLRKFVLAMTAGGIPFSSVVWSRVFIDEADTLAFTLRPMDIYARFMWFITGSWLNMLFPTGLYIHTVQALPPNVRALIGDGGIAGASSRYNVVAWSLADTREGQFATLILRNTDAWIDSSLQRPSIIHDTIMCKAPANLGVLRDFISAAAMEALHAGDTEGALAALGLKAASKETLAQRVTESLRGDLIQAEKILAFKRDIEYSSAAAKVAAIEKAEGKVTRIRTQLTTLESRLASLAQELCPICYDTPRTTTLTPCCRQAFCLSCLCECITGKPSCPMCRAAIPSVKELLVIGEEAEVVDQGENSAVDTHPTKGAALLQLLSSSTADQRFLVFSAHEASFKGLREVLAARDIRCEMLQGSAARVERLRAQFRDGSIRVLCMNARHVGAGINLEAATHVVLYHRMNMELERQVIGRAVRFERATDLRVVHLTHDEETAYNGASSSEVIVHV
jgi:hypothetical protein